MRSSILLALLLAACGGDGISRTVGARCDVTADCDDRCLGPSGDFPQGFCSVDCSSNDDCPSDTDCVDREGGVCLFVCATDGDCGFLGPGWFCKDDNLRGSPDVRTSVCRGD